MTQRLSLLSGVEPAAAARAAPEELRDARAALRSATLSREATRWAEAGELDGLREQAETTASVARPTNRSLAILGSALVAGRNYRPVVREFRRLGWVCLRGCRRDVGHMSHDLRS